MGLSPSSELSNMRMVWVSPELAIGMRSEGCPVWTVLPLPPTSQLADLLKVASGYRGGGW